MYLQNKYPYLKNYLWLLRNGLRELNSRKVKWTCFLARKFLEMKKRTAKSWPEMEACQLLQRFLWNEISGRGVIWWKVANRASRPTELVWFNGKLSVWKTHVNSSHFLRFMIYKDKNPAIFLTTNLRELFIVESSNEILSNFQGILGDIFKF